MNDRRVLRAGIVGCGLIAEKHASLVGRLHGCRLTAVCDRDEALATRFSRRFGAPLAYASIDEMLYAGVCDVVHITTSPATHSALTCRALETGHHVLVEKPAAMTLAELDLVEAAAARTRVRFGVVHNMLYEPAARAARGILAAGHLGRVVALHFRDLYPYSDPVLSDDSHWCHRLPGGMFGEMLPHPLYFAESLLPGLKPATAYASRFGARPWLDADELTVVLGSADAVAVMSLSLNAPRESFEVDVVGERGVLRVDVTAGMVQLVRDTGRPSRAALALGNLSHAGAIGFQTLVAAAGTLMRGRPSGHEIVLRDFYRELRRGEGFDVSPERVRATTTLYEQVCGLLTGYLR